MPRLGGIVAASGGMELRDRAQVVILAYELGLVVAGTQQP